MNAKKTVLWTTLAVVACPVLAFAADPAKTDWKFQFAPGKAANGYTVVAPNEIYDASKGYGFEAGSAVMVVDRGDATPLHAGFVTGSGSYYFSVAEPEGNYKVTVTLGDAKEASDTTVKAELRRLMVENAVTKPGEFVTKSFVVNVRVPDIAGGGRVRLKQPRETTQEIRAWDDKLTLEFIGNHPAVAAVEVEKVDVPTVFVLGDSTTCDQSTEPFGSWGQQFPRFFTDGIAIANHGESGETSSSALGEQRFAKILSVMKKGDYFIVAFGHNDQKDKGPTAGAFNNYSTNFRKFVDDVRAKGGIPIICTPVSRKGGPVGDYPAAALAVAKEKNVPAIDLSDKTVTFYKTLGDSWANAFATPASGKTDQTHHDDYGSYEIAKMVVQGIKDNNLDLAKYISPDFTGFDPSKPDDFKTFDVPKSSAPARVETPLGN